MTTVYFICVCFAVGRDLARRERRRVIRRGPFSTKRNFLATRIRHCLCSRLLPRHQRPLMLGMVSSAFFAPLMLGIREPAQGGLLELATDVLAVALASVVRTTDDERLPAVAAGQLEGNELVHPSRQGENWATASWTATVRGVLARSIHRLDIEGSGGNLSPHSFHPTVGIIGTAPTAPPLLELGRGPQVPVG